MDGERLRARRGGKEAEKNMKCATCSGSKYVY
jgi:hypothetical protein